MKNLESVEIKFDPIPDALAAIRNGECIVVVDDERRENEGDLICAAEYATPKQINFMATQARGLICLAMGGDRLDQLDLPLMVDRNTDSNQTAFTVSIDAGPEHGVTTGISADDRAKTIQVALKTKTKPQDLRRPGHIFPLRAKDGGVLKRAGHTEAAVDLSKLSGLNPSGVICEIQNEDGSMARLPELYEYSKIWNLKLISIADLIRYRLENERFVLRKATADLPSLFGGFQAIGYKNEIDGSEHVALVKGQVGDLKEPVLVRMHSECLTGDAFGSLRCDCRPQLEAALSRIDQQGEGVVVYLRQEGRGIGLINKLKAYSLQDGGLDTVEANEKLGFPADLRNYGVGAQILTDLGIHRLSLLTNNPRKIAGLGGYGLRVENRVPLVICPGDHNAAYLAVKREKLGHLIEADSEANNITQDFILFFCDGLITINQITKNKHEVVKSIKDYNVELSPVSSPRLLAILQTPRYAYRLIINQKKYYKAIDYKQTNIIESILSNMANWEGIKRVGMLKTDSSEKALHPSQNICTHIKSISELDSLNNNKIREIYNSIGSVIISWN